jgi:hypothetical protein
MYYQFLRHKSLRVLYRTQPRAAPRGLPPEPQSDTHTASVSPRARASRFAWLALRFVRRQRTAVAVSELSLLELSAAQLCQEERPQAAFLSRRMTMKGSEAGGGKEQPTRPQSSRVKVPAPPIAWIQAVSISDARGGNEPRSART